MTMLKAGDCVRSHNNPEQEGMVIAVYSNYWRLPDIDDSVLTKEEWLLVQDTRFTYEEVNLENWYIVQLFTGELMWSCHTRIEFIGVIDTDGLLK
jgi:hypothetical protein